MSKLLHLLDKEVNAQKESLKKNFWGSRKLTKKCAMKMKETKKQCVRKNVIHGRKHFIERLRRTGENDWDKLRVSDSEGTVPLNYNFIVTRVSMSGATKYFACQMPNFAVEICISTRRDVAFRRGIYTRRSTWHFTCDGIVTFTCDMVVLTKLNNWQDSSCL